MTVVAVSHISKSFGTTRAVDDVSFDLQPGEILGLLGPNGAGKTTTIRLILDIFKPESGDIAVFGGPMTDEKKNDIGYMPEERGLYKDIPLERCLVYLATLKGLSRREALVRANSLLERLDLDAHKDKKVSELSKGMQQKAQIIVTLLHDPKLIIIDEPFAGLDPVNTQLVKTMLLDERAQGKAIIMSTHQMHQVEEMCDRIVLIHRGQVVLRGTLEDVRSQFSGHAVIVAARDELPEIPGVLEVLRENHTSRMTLEPETTPQEVLSYLVTREIPVDRFAVATPTLDEIFVRVVQGDESP